MKKALLLTLIVLLALPFTALAQDQPHAGVEIVTNFMQSGTYDIGAEQLEPGFEEMTGIELEIVASPFVVLVQNNITDLSTGTGEFDVISGDFWIGSVWNHMHPLDELMERDMWEPNIIPGLMLPGPSGYFRWQAHRHPL